MSTQPYLETELEQARIRFGLMLKAWMHSGGWSTKTPMEWAKAAGLPQISNNTVSFIWAGTQPKTSPSFFTNLGYLNHRLAAKDYGPIQNRKLRDRVACLEPLCHANGTPWGAVDFFACYIGQLSPPDAFNLDPPEKPRLLSDQVAQRISSHKQKLFEDHTAASGLSKAEAWEQLKILCAGLSADQVDAFQQVLSGWRSWTPLELEELKDEQGRNRAVLALEEWCGMDLTAELQQLCSISG